jgi:hypothetical protein
VRQTLVTTQKGSKPMHTITFNLNCKLEERLRKYTGRKGDLSKILNEAVEDWLNQKENQTVGKKEMRE